MEATGGNEKRKSDGSAAGDSNNSSKKGASTKRATNANVVNENGEKSQEKRKTNAPASTKRKSIGEGSEKNKTEDVELPPSLPQKSIAHEGRKSTQRKSLNGEEETKAENDHTIHPVKSASGMVGRKSNGRKSLGASSEETENGAAGVVDASRAPQKSIAAEPEVKPNMLRVTNPNIRTSPPQKGEDPEEQSQATEQRRRSRSSLKGEPKIRRETQMANGDEEGESEQSELFEDQRGLLGDANVPLEIEEFAEEPEVEVVEIEKSRGSILKEKWHGISQFIRRTFDEPSRVFKLRGYHSEPNLSLPFEDKFDPKYPTEDGDFPKTLKKFVSCEDIVFCIGNEHPNLVRGVLSEIKLRSYAIDEKAKTAWQEVVELEKKRFSFFDELFAMGYVVDSLEVLSPPPKGEDGKPSQSEYFVEAEERHYRKKVDYGRVVFKTKHVYTGNFLDWYFEGPGRYSWQDGTIYQGEFSHGLMHGPGSIHWPDGCVYEGHFINGIRTGWGVYSTADGYTFAGEWFKGLPHGYGKMWYDPDDDENDYYEGQWEKGLPQGVGTRQYSTGDRYVGNWARGLRNGYGIMIWLQERQVYKGDWLDGVPHGFGKHIWYLERSTSNPFPTRHVYQGAWLLGRREGIGKMIYPCGSVYEGRWKNGQRHGKGMFINPAGDILVGLFRAGSILGGSDVPLHAPTYDCDYGGLTEWLIAKFSLNLEDSNDEESLHDITKLYLPYIRKLYHRAGEFSQKYGNHGLYPAYMKKTNNKAKSHPDQSKHHPNDTPDYGHHHNVDLDPDSHPHHRGYSRLDEPRHMKGKVEKPDALDGVNPVTRFGLWLILRDCDSLMDEVTMAYYDKIWCETPPLSFQTRHNPFEPVYLWQFLQCLIVTAVAYYVDIPRLRQPLPEKEFATLEEQVLSEITLRAGISETEQKRIRLVHHRRAMATSLKGAEMLMSNKKVGQHHHHHHRKTSVGQESHSKKGAPNDELKKQKRHSLKDQKDTDAIEKKVQGSLPRPKGKSKGQQSLLPHSGNHEIETIVVPHVDSKSQRKGNNNETDTEEDIRKKSVIFNRKPDKQEVEKDEDRTNSGTNVEPVSISKCFEKLLTEKLLPCLKREPGSNLPVVPQPLPALVDMYDAFRGIKNRDILRGTEFVRSALPHLLFPNPKDAIWWHRCPEALSHSVDFDELLETFRSKFQNVEEEIAPEENWEDKLESEYLGTQARNSETTLRILNLVSTDADEPAPHPPHHHQVPPVQDHDPTKEDDENQELELRKTESDEEFTSLSDFVTEGHPFAEDELVPEPFLWADDYKCIPVHRKYQHFENINSRDVFNVLQTLYPNLCTGEHEKELHFELIFCDWLWCISLLAKACTEREFRDAWKGSFQRPITNPQSLGVYAHFVKQIKNNPYLNPPPDFRPKRKQRQSFKKNSIANNPGNSGHAQPKKSILKGTPVAPHVGAEYDIGG
ncbi:unnamed protein product [Orchesella dallaii]|uniref:Radial spoke head 10 B n=1 Tax=Orchesella dallaii TaxID=48710 RepID=A0ABP1RNH1_9HEXA